MLDSIHSVTLILQREIKLGQQIAQRLYKDHHIILGPVSKITHAYRLLLDEIPHFAIIDASICEEKIERLSDSLTLMEIQHVVTNGAAHTLMKRSILDGMDTISNIESGAPVEELIANTLWDMHTERVMFHWLEDAAMSRKLHS